MEALIIDQQLIVDSIKKCMTNYKKDSKSRKTQSYFANRIASLTEYWKDFKENHRKIVHLKKGNEEMCKKYFDQEVYSEIEEFYICSKTKLEDDRLELCPDEVEEKGKGNMCEKVIECTAKKEEVHLPKINIPKFSGDYKTWMSFHDLYVTLIHDNKHLKSCVQGEAEEIIRHYTVTDANYEVAWKTLQERYDNKRILVKTQLKVLFSQPFANDDTART